MAALFNRKPGSTAIDFAGAAVGGARRFRDEYEKFSSGGDSSVQVIGWDEFLTPRHLVSREYTARNCEHVIAANNASFSLAGEKRTVLLRNALHFASSDEMKLAGGANRIDYQVPIIRALAHRADRIVVPCSAMADRVTTLYPKLSSRLEVRFHPVGRPFWAGAEPTAPREVLLPSLPAPYKRLGERVDDFIKATEGTDIVLRVTAGPDELGPVEEQDRVRLIGKLDPGTLSRHWEECAAVYFPTVIESFGYPLAEARCGGRHVIAADTSQNREIAGGALCSFEPGDCDSLGYAIGLAVGGVPSPDPAPFDPEHYFVNLLDF